VSIVYKSWFEVVGRIPEFTEEEHRDLPLMFWADREYFLSRGGKVARAFVDALPADVRSEALNYVARSERLEKGWYPNVPHYHIDGLPPITEGVVDYRKQHDIVVYMCCVGDVSLTRFLVGDVELPDTSPQEKTFDRWTEEIAKQIAEGKVKEHEVEPFNIVKFGYGSLHRCTAAKRTGYRYFIHAAANTGVTPMNLEDFQIQLQLIPRHRCKHSWPQDVQIPRRP
jgi:hypothetical protein